MRHRSDMRRRSLTCGACLKTSQKLRRCTQHRRVMRLLPSKHACCFTAATLHAQGGHPPHPCAWTHPQAHAHTQDTCCVQALAVLMLAQRGCATAGTQFRHRQLALHAPAAGPGTHGAAGHAHRPVGASSSAALRCDLQAPAAAAPHVLCSLLHAATRRAVRANCFLRRSHLQATWPPASCRRRARPAAQTLRPRTHAHLRRPSSERVVISAAVMATLPARRHRRAAAAVAPACTGAGAALAVDCSVQPDDAAAQHVCS